MDYPSQLPAALQQGHRSQMVSPLLRSQLAGGRARQRRAYTSVPQNVTLEWVLTNGQALLFEAWFRWVIKDGAAWHQMPVKTAMGCASERVRFVDVYDGPIIVSGNLLRYRAEVEIFERRTLDEDWLLAPEMVAGASIFDAAMNSHWPDTDFPVEFEDITPNMVFGATMVDGAVNKHWPPA